MIYQVIWMTQYINKHLIKWPKRKMIKQFAIDMLIIAIGCFLTKDIILNVKNYFEWILLAAKDALIWGTTVGIINIIFYKKNLQNIVMYLVSKVNKNRIFY